MATAAWLLASGCSDDAGSETITRAQIEREAATFPVYIEVTEVEDGDAQFDIEVGEAPIE